MMVCNADGRVAVSSLQQSAAAAEADRTTETLVLRRLPIPTATSCDLESAADHRRTGRAVVAHPAAVRVRRPRRCLGCGRAVANGSGKKRLWCSLRCFHIDERRRRRERNHR